ncbi:rod shape-determining protein MreC [Methylococcus sp. EFPC2]|uniref:rod shape-determining protein MreC n=1 Tax=Methylococcus sp. EFPC2 TaxID=2812648 RepID=UPI001F080357|nr:rod shape-determining protein MreC [Methylococcus sp. EFPC2]
MFASLALLVVEKQSLWPDLRTPFAVSVYPLQQLVSSPVRLFQDLKSIFADNARLRDENEAMAEELAVLNTRLLRFEALEQENIRLRGLLETSFKLGEQVQIAELLAVNLAPYEHVVVVNKGSRFGAYPGQPVMDAHGVVGQVLRVTPYSAEVMLITDPNHAIPVQVNRNGLRTIALGTGQIDKLSLPYLTGNADIQPGDLLVTSGMGGLFPQGYPVATVNAVSSQASPFAKVTATPVAQLDRNRELLLVWSKSEPIPRIPDGPETHKPENAGPPEKPHAAK